MNIAAASSVSSSTRSRAPRSSEALGYAMSCRGASIPGWFAGDPRLFSAGQGTVENFLRELVAGKARR